MGLFRRERKPIPELHIDANVVVPEELDRSDAVRVESNTGFVDEAAEMERLNIAREREQVRELKPK
jgi:hypothetical protein